MRSPIATLTTLLVLAPGASWAQSGGDKEVPPDLDRRRRAAPGRTAPPPRRAASRKAPRRVVFLTNKAEKPRGSKGRKVTRYFGHYSGVTPGLPRMPRIWLPRNAATRCYITWIGFQLLPTGSRVFVQSNRKPTWQVRSQGDSLVLRFPGCRVLRSNNTRPLYAHYFPTPVITAHARRHRKASEVTISLRLRTRHKTRSGRLQGWHYVFITFPKTRYVPIKWRRRVRRRRAKRRRRGRRGRRVLRLGPDR